jgi:hypothetical protein
MNNTKDRQNELYNEYQTGNNIMDMQLIKTILNDKKQSVHYNFGTTEDYHINYGYNYEDQDLVNKLMCHWMDYQVAGIKEENRKNVPVAVASGSYKKWMLAVGFNTDRDPHTYPWSIPKELDFYGVFVVVPFGSENLSLDPKAVYYIDSTSWNDDYFLKVGDFYAAVMEPPETDTNYNMNTILPEKDSLASDYLNKKIYAYSYAMPWDTIGVYNKEVHELLLKNPEYRESLKNPAFKQAMDGTRVRRIYKVEKENSPYAIIPYDRYVSNQLTTPMIIAMGLDGKFESVTASNDTKKYFKIRDRWEAFFAVWNQIYNSGRYVINNWPATEKNYPLSPVYNTITYGRIIDEEKNQNYYNTVEIALLHDNSILTKNTSPIIEPVGSYSKGNASYEFTWKYCEQLAVAYAEDEMMYNLIIDSDILTSENLL